MFCWLGARGRRLSLPRAMAGFQIQDGWGVSTRICDVSGCGQPLDLPPEAQSMWACPAHLCHAWKIALSEAASAAVARHSKGLYALKRFRAVLLSRRGCQS